MNDVRTAVSALLAELSPEERATLTELLLPRAEPIAVVGLGCRFPGGAVDPPSFWRLLEGGQDAVRELPQDRWAADALYDPDPEAAGKMYTRYGAFLDRVDRFEPQFFDISAHEAARMDPQQRLLLEVAWEALEDAGQPPEELHETPTGVFIGSCTHDYEQLQTRSASLDQLDAHALVGDLGSVLAGRLSYTFGLTGPSLVVDTACSSSLVAIHLAVQSLQKNECSVALAGGVNLILAPDGFVKLSRMRALSADGRCRTFDLRANGYARGEGAGVLALKRLGDAERDGNRIWAVIRGSAVNHDGRSASLTAPSGRAQCDVLRAALGNAGVAPAEVGYIEAHGTGTPLGDPIELEALKEVFGAARADASQCAVGSVKTNLGHLEGAAGVAGVIKTILALWHEKIPPHLHFTQLNPRVSLAGTPLVIGARPWPRRAAARSAGVSSFGISGTNAHIVVSEAPVVAPRLPSAPGAEHALHLSAKSDVALKELARRLATALTADSRLDLADVVHTLDRRARHACQITVSATSSKEAAAHLSAFADGTAASGVLSGQASASSSTEKRPGRTISLPTYPFQRESFWLPQRPHQTTPERQSESVSQSPAESQPAHPAKAAAASQPEPTKPPPSTAIPAETYDAPSDTPDAFAALAARARFSAMSAEERLATLLQEVESVTRSILGLDPAFSLKPEQRLDELGLDSLLALDLVRALSHALQTPLSATMAMDYPTVGAMARLLTKELA